MMDKIAKHENYTDLWSPVLQQSWTLTKVVLEVDAKTFYPLFFIFLKSQAHHEWKMLNVYVCVCGKWWWQKSMLGVFLRLHPLTPVHQN